MESTLSDARQETGALAGPLNAAAYGATRPGFKPATAGLRFKTFAAVAVLLLLALPGGSRAEQPLKLLMLGDSLVAGFGLGPGDTLPEQLQGLLRSRGHAVAVTNAGVSGDTTAGGLARLPWLLGEPFDAAVVALGANDGLRGLDPGGTRENLTRIVALLRERGIPVLLAGMIAPPNLGVAYAGQFNPIYADLAARDGVALYPFILAGVATEPALNQADGIHPNAEGVAVIVRGMLAFVEDLLAEAR